jgi:hypothetical protein
MPSTRTGSGIERRQQRSGKTSASFGDAPTELAPTFQGQDPELLHQISERLTAAGNYIKSLQIRAEIGVEGARRRSADILDRALSQLDQANELFRRLRRSLDGPSPLDDDAGRDYRVCFLNQFSRANAKVTACQRSILIRSAKSREAAIEAAKERFVELEGIRDWRTHASAIEATSLAGNATERSAELGSAP